MKSIKLDDLYVYVLDNGDVAKISKEDTETSAGKVKTVWVDHNGTEHSKLKDAKDAFEAGEIKPFGEVKPKLHDPLDPPNVTSEFDGPDAAKFIGYLLSICPLDHLDMKFGAAVDKDSNAVSLDEAKDFVDRIFHVSGLGTYGDWDVEACQREMERWRKVVAAPPVDEPPAEPEDDIDDLF
jgi:hypothetical protein